MTINLNVTITAPGFGRGLGQIMTALDLISKGQEKMDQKLQAGIDSLKSEVAKLQTVEASVLAYVKGVPALIADAVTAAANAGATPEQLQSISDAVAAIDANATELAAAITANTPPVVTPADGGGDPAPGGTPTEA